MNGYEDRTISNAILYDYDQVFTTQKRYSIVLQCFTCCGTQLDLQQTLPKVMKTTITLTICIFLSFCTLADTGTLESLELNCEKVGVQLDNQDNSVILTFTNYPEVDVHTVIDIKRINDLEYKTRVMRYFGGLLVNNTFHFETLVVVINGKRMEYDWTRANVCILVNKICDQALVI